ncbi:MAG: nitrilase-related carbon-nitrogen hydrolase [Steroidobacteraceae bacterium]
MTRLLTLAPPVERGGTADAALANAQRLIDALRRELQVPADIVLLPLGCLSGGEGLDSRDCANDALTLLREAAQGLQIILAGAERIGGVATGFVFAPCEETEIWQPSLAESKGARAEVTVIESAHGTLACLPGADLLHAEYARLALFAGAEILLAPTAESLDERSAARQLSRGARAWENHAAVATVNLEPARHAMWNHNGHLLLEGSGTSARATLDLPSLRARRLEPWVNFPAQLRTGLYAAEYARGEPLPRVTESSAATPPVEAYDVLLMQTHQAFVSNPDTRDATVADNLKRALGLARLFAMRPSTRLVVFPEFFLQGSDGSHPHEYWERCGIRIPGPETAELAAFAKACNVYVCGAVLEYDPSWPRRYFNTSIIIDPQGEIVLRYRKLQCADLNGLLNITTPGNLYSAYIERYGLDSLVPVIDTPIGRLGTLICFDSNWPELWRALALRGAEVICNPTSEIHSNRRPYWYQAKRAHAAEQMVYVASANAGSEQFFAGAPVTGMNRGHSALIDFHGELVACADGPGVIPLLGRIELGALRRARTAHANDPAVRFDPRSVAAAYKDFPGFPLDCFLHTPMELASEGVALVVQQIEQLKQRGVLKAP